MKGFFLNTFSINFFLNWSGKFLYIGPKICFFILTTFEGFTFNKITFAIILRCHYTMKF